MANGADTRPAHLYVHHPYCLGGRCSYCAFHSAPYSSQATERWFASLVCAPMAPLETLYCGGGTPTALGKAGWERFARWLRATVSLARDYEWTVEAHPQGLSLELLEFLRKTGVNRISLGVQSLEDSVLLRANRRHSAKDALQAFRRIREAGFDNAGVDLIAGLPGSTRAGWESTLQRVLALRPEHLSIYALSIEEGSRFASDGVIANEESALEQLAIAYETLQGYKRYEVSNFARPGFECRHNLSCWRGGDYLGIGTGASSRLGRLRRTIEPEGVREEMLSEAEDAQERALFRLRLAEGIDLDECPVMAPARRVLERAAARGHLTQSGTRFAPTALGFRYLDALLRDVLAVLPPAEKESDR